MQHVVFSSCCVLGAMCGDHSTSKEDPITSLSTVWMAGT